MAKEIVISELGNYYRASLVNFDKKGETGTVIYETKGVYADKGDAVVEVMTYCKQNGMEVDAP